MNEDWDLNEMSPRDLGVILAYFSMTTLSTVGFGDLYPRNTIERILCSIYLLFGVMLFSYFMGKLKKMIIKFKMQDKDENYEGELVKFFQTLEKYNMGHPINKKLQADITEYVNFQIDNNRNKFQLLESDRSLFN